MKKIIIFLSFLVFFAFPAMAAPIYGYSVNASGTYSGTLNSVLGAHDDNFIQIDNGTVVTVKFQNGFAALANGLSSADLRVHTYDAPAPVNGRIEISANGVDFVNLGIFSDANTNNVIDFDLDALGFSYVTAVRITDISGTSDGFDLDAIEGFNGGTIPVPEPATWMLCAILFFFLKLRK